MAQSRAKSLLEASLNTFTGYLIAVALQTVLYPLYGLDVTMLDNFSLAAIFTLASLTRSYLWRRYFNSRGEEE